MAVEVDHHSQLHPRLDGNPYTRLSITHALARTVAVMESDHQPETRLSNRTALPSHPVLRVRADDESDALVPPAALLPVLSGDPDRSSHTRPPYTFSKESRQTPLVASSPSTTSFQPVNRPSDGKTGAQESSKAKGAENVNGQVCRFVYTIRSVTPGTETDCDGSQ
jgi:hypothetical protein